MKIHFAFCLMLLIFARLTSFAQDYTELERIVDEELREKKAVGAATAIINDGKVVFAKGFGIAARRARSKSTFNRHRIKKRASSANMFGRLRKL